MAVDEPLITREEHQPTMKKRSTVPLIIVLCMLIITTLATTVLVHNDNYKTVLAALGMRRDADTTTAEEQTVPSGSEKSGDSTVNETVPSQEASELVNDKELIIDDLQKIGPIGLNNLNTYANQISRQYGMDIAFFLTTNDYAPRQKLGAYSRERWSDIQNGFVLVHDIDGKLWSMVSFGKAERIITSEIEDRLWAVYDAEDAYYSGAQAFLKEAEEILKQSAPLLATLDNDPDSLDLLVDEAKLLSSVEASVLRKRLETLSARWKNDIVIVTVDSTGVKTPMVFADDWFDDNGYGQGANNSGLLLLISMEERDWWISTCGYSITAFTDAGIEYIGKKMTANGLSTGDYAKAFNCFADYCAMFFAEAATGTPYDKGHLPQS